LSEIRGGETVGGEEGKKSGGQNTPRGKKKKPITKRKKRRVPPKKEKKKIFRGHGVVPLAKGPGSHIFLKKKLTGPEVQEKNWGEPLGGLGWGKIGVRGGPPKKKKAIVRRKTPKVSGKGEKWVPTNGVPNPPPKTWVWGNKNGGKKKKKKKERQKCGAQSKETGQKQKGVLFFWTKPPKKRKGRTLFLGAWGGGTQKEKTLCNWETTPQTSTTRQTLKKTARGFLPGPPLRVGGKPRGGQRLENSHKKTRGVGF